MTDRSRRNQRCFRADESIVADDRAVFVYAVVVADDGARTDVDAAADGRVPKIAQMVGLGLVANVGPLGLDEVADMHVVGQPGTGTHPRIGTNLAVCTYDDTIEMTVRRDLATRPYFDILQHATWADFDFIRQTDLSFKYAVYVDKHIGAAIEFTAQIETPWIRQGRATRHETPGILQLMNAFKIGKLLLAVNAQDLPFVCRNGRAHFGFRCNCKPHHIGKVVLFLCIVVVQLC